MIKIENLWKSYGDLTVLKDINMTLKDDGVYCLMAPSGTGKTTLFRQILGLETPDKGSIVTDLGEHPYSVVFQEDRLCEEYSPLVNLSMVCGKTRTKEEIRQEAMRLLPEESLTRPVRTLSGGMKRRVAILRAVLAPSRAILMDEPFTGLDKDLRHTVIDYILEKREDRLLLVATHQAEDVDMLHAALLTLQAPNQPVA